MNLKSICALPLLLVCLVLQLSSCATSPSREIVLTKHTMDGREVEHVWVGDAKGKMIKKYDRYLDSRGREVLHGYRQTFDQPGGLGGSTMERFKDGVLVETKRQND